VLQDDWWRQRSNDVDVLDAEANDDNDDDDVYDTILYDTIYVRSKANNMASLVQRTAQKQKIRKN